MDVTVVKQKLEVTDQAFQHWRKTTFEYRSELMMRVAVLLRKNKEVYVRMATLEMGKLLSEARAEVEKSATACEYFATGAQSFLADLPMVTEARKSMVIYQPIGAVLAIMPWNFPFWQVMRFAAPAIMAGNVVLLKHAANVTQCALLLEKLFEEAGFPEGVFQTLVIENTLIETVIQADIVQGVALTGSELAGSQVAALAGKNIKKTVLELGGSDAFIVLPDADVEKAALVAAQSRMQNVGQSCIAAKRFLIAESVKDVFLHHFLKHVSAIKQGNPFDETSTMGPLARIDLAEKLEKQLSVSIEKGAHLVVGGSRDGCNVQPIVLDKVRPGMPAFDEETFGPLAAIISVKDEADAIALANQSRYGLGASIWTTDLQKAEHLARELETGSVLVNALMRSDVRLPFGGVKKSGYGRELSFMGIHEFVSAKTISIA